MVLAEIEVVEAIEEAIEEAVEVGAITEVPEEVTQVVKIPTSLTVEAQVDPIQLITSKCVLTCQSQEDASRVLINAHSFTLKMTSPINKYREEVKSNQTIWEEILECQQILNKMAFKT